MTKLYVGPKNSGKSLAAEGFCTRGGSCPTYLATLPKLPEFESRISRHQRRRARSPWRMRYMCVPAPNLLEEMAEASRESGLVLLDGFSAILKAQYCFFGADAPSMARLTDDILDIVDHSEPACEWVIVDNEHPSDGGALPLPLRWSIDRAQARLVAGARSMERIVKDDRRDLTCSRK